MPFKNKFNIYPITDPLAIPQAITAYKDDPDVDIIVIDTITFMMDMYESLYVLGAVNTQQMWGEFQQFFKNLMQQEVAQSDKQIIMLAHTAKTLQSNGKYDTAVPVKGALKNNGLEAYFNIVISTTKMELKDLKDYKNDLLNITEKDEIRGYKHVFQTQTVKSTVGDRIRGPEDLFSIKETYIDNDAGILLKRLNEYYND